MIQLKVIQSVFYKYFLSVYFVEGRHTVEQYESLNVNENVTSVFSSTSTGNFIISLLLNLH